VSLAAVASVPAANALGVSDDSSAATDANLAGANLSYAKNADFAKNFASAKWSNPTCPDLTVTNTGC
jgi:hypothetical protein